VSFSLLDKNGSAKAMQGSTPRPKTGLAVKKCKSEKICIAEKESIS